MHCLHRLSPNLCRTGGANDPNPARGGLFIAAPPRSPRPLFLFFSGAPGEPDQGVGLTRAAEKQKEGGWGGYARTINRPPLTGFRVGKKNWRPLFGWRQRALATLYPSVLLPFDPVADALLNACGIRAWRLWGQPAPGRLLPGVAPAAEARRQGDWLAEPPGRQSTRIGLNWWEPRCLSRS